LKIEVGCVAEEDCKAHGAAKALLRGTHFENPNLPKNRRYKYRAKK